MGKKKTRKKEGKKERRKDGRKEKIFLKYMTTSSDVSYKCSIRKEEIYYIQKYVKTAKKRYKLHCETDVIFLHFVIVVKLLCLIKNRTF